MSDIKIDFPVSLVLPAGGCGERMGVSQPKQYCTVLNRPLIVFTLNTFNRISWIQHIAITVSSQYIDYVQSLVKEYEFKKVIVAEGATTRHRSIYYGLKALEKVCKLTDIVVIHDAVRIFAEEELLKEIVLGAKMFGTDISGKGDAFGYQAAGVTRPLVSTVIAVDSNNFLEESLDRNRYRASEMPQAFMYDIIKTAYDKATDYDFDYGTECLLLAHKYTNTQAKIIDGPSSLWKVTYKKDLHAAEGMLKESLISVQLIGCNEDVEQKLRNAIEERRLKISGHVSSAMENVMDTTANSFVFMYNSQSLDIIKSNSLQCVTLNDSSHFPLIDHVVVHICIMDNFDGDQYMKFVKFLQSFSVTMRKRHCLVYGILCKVNEDKEFVSKMAASVLWNRDPVLSGQVFVGQDDH